MDFRKLIKEQWPYFYFFLLTVVIFSGFIFSDKMLFGSDTIGAGITFRSFYADFVKTYHRIPLWNPYIFGGLPYVDAMHGDTFYPLAALQFIMPLSKALGYKLVITVFLAGVFMNMYLRKMKLSLWASVIGATAYMLSGFLVSLVYAGHDGRMYVTSLLPLLLFTMEIAFEKRKIFWWWPFSVTFGLLVLANHPQFAYFAMWLTGAYFLLRLISNYFKEKQIKLLTMPLIGFIAALIFGLALSSIQLLPTQDYVRKYSPRAEGGKGYEYAASWSLHAEEAFSQLVPGFAGYSSMQNHPQLTEEQTYWGKNYFKINSEYAGFTALMLALLGLFIYRDRYSYFFLGTAIFALLYALGDGGFIFKIIYYIVPFVNKFRAPSTIMFLFCFSIAFLAARAIDELGKIKKSANTMRIFWGLVIAAGAYLLGGLLTSIAGMKFMGIYTSIFFPKIEVGQLDILRANLPNITLGFFIGALIIGAILVIFWSLMRKKTTTSTMAIVLLIMIVIDNWLINDMRFISPVDPAPYFAKPTAVDFLKNQPGSFRCFPFPQTLSSDDKLSQFGLEETVGYHGNQLRWYNDFIGGNGLTNLFGKPAGLALTNTRYLLGKDARLTKQMDAVQSFELASVAGDIRIYRNKAALERARIIYDYQVVSDPDQMLTAVFDPKFDFVNKIIIDRQPKNNIAKPTSASSDTAYTENTVPDRIKVKARLSAPGFLALQDNWYPYWKAFEGKTEVPIYRCDYTFMAIELPAGEHELELRIENPYYNISKTVTKLTWLIFFCGIIGGVIFKYTGIWKKKE